MADIPGQVIHDPSSNLAPLIMGARGCVRATRGRSGASAAGRIQGGNRVAPRELCCADGEGGAYALTRRTRVVIMRPCTSGSHESYKICCLLAYAIDLRRLDFGHKRGIGAPARLIFGRTGS